MIRPLPAGAVGQLDVQWRYSAGKMDCVITNRSGWRVEELQMEVRVWANRRVVRSHGCPIVATIPPGGVASVELPLQLQIQPRQSFECRVLAAQGFAPSRAW